MKISSSLLRTIAWCFGITLLMSVSVFVSVREVRDTADEVRLSRAQLDRIEQKIDAYQKLLERIDTELKTVIVMKGTASWYGPGFDGRKTASGEVYNMNAFTLAHKQLPLGTWVAITNEVNGKTAFGIVTDRGPYVLGRDFDVSLALAKRLGFELKGLTRVSVRILGVT